MVGFTSNICALVSQSSVSIIAVWSHLSVLTFSAFPWKACYITAVSVSFSYEVKFVSKLSLVVMTVRVMRGSATELRWRPNTVANVPPLHTSHVAQSCYSNGVTRGRGRGRNAPGDTLQEEGKKTFGKNFPEGKMLWTNLHRIVKKRGRTGKKRWWVTQSRGGDIRVKSITNDSHEVMSKKGRQFFRRK